MVQPTEQAVPRISLTVPELIESSGGVSVNQKSALNGLTFQLAGHTARAHGAGNLDNLIEGNVAVVLDVLDLLSVTGRLLQSLDDQRSSRWHHLDGGLTVLDNQLAGDLQALPVRGGLGDIITDLLWRQTEGTDLGGKR